MALSLSDLFSTDDLDARVASGHVRVRDHPTKPLAVANYTSRATYDQVWDDVTTQCRGLIWHRQTQEIVARPFAKFFDLYETRLALPDRPPAAHEKLDGSLGILYRFDGEWAVATRGSFDSEQAIWATRFLRARYSGLRVPAGVTPLVEILYRDNRIVIDHGREDLVLVGAIEVETGADVPLWEIDWWPGQMADHHLVRTAHEAYQLATGAAFDDREGLVLTWYRPGRPSLRAKVKHPRYVELHRLLTATTERDVWKSVVAADWRERASATAIGRVLSIDPAAVRYVPLLDEMLAFAPEAFADEVRDVEARLRAAHAAVIAHIDRLWAQRPDGERRQFAQWASTTGHGSLLFSRLDGDPWELQAWSLVRPEAIVVGGNRAGEATCPPGGR